MMKNILGIIVFFILIEFYIYQAVRTVVSQTWARNAYWIVTVAVYAIIIYLVTQFDRASRNPLQINIIMGLILVFVLPKLLTFVFLLFEDIIRLCRYGFEAVSSGRDAAHMPSRRKFVSILGLGTAGLLSYAFLDGMIFGKYRHRVRKVKLKLKGLPESFKGYKIVQISDVHSGTFQEPAKLQHAIDLINQQKPDLVLFTGDMVNNYADEFKPFINLFKTIQAKDGKFSVLGNHDYGGYGKFNSKEEERQNVPNLIQYQKEAGFKMLQNENLSIEKNGDKIYLLGVENWGEKPFPQYGDLDKALQDVPEDSVKILMSHDPTHFDFAVKNHPNFVHLTLSGHTHGMQFGVDLKNVKWSPVEYKYKKWMDLYESNGRYLYVNRGFGVIGYSGRVGILPEITLFELS
ncbi:metallophosphoesterase [Soonwooa sp.]|uniref:metallophosphoesterase n=1 Tax=Soonwooa sp. TaxID=1938592 RepID=UPI00262E99E3|nr:metallophosphoesterase [Soonwooa sp.]